MKDRTRPSGQRCVLKHFWAYPLIEMWEMRGGNLSTAIATFGGRYARELFWCYSWLFMPSWSFLYIKLAISCIFHKSITDIRTDGPTDRRTDTPSYRDARTHLKNLKRIMVRDRMCGVSIDAKKVAVAISNLHHISWSICLIWSKLGKKHRS